MKITERKISAKFVLQILTDKQEEYRVTTCEVCFHTCQTKPHFEISLLQNSSFFVVSYDPEISARVWSGEHGIMFVTFLV